MNWKLDSLLDNPGWKLPRFFTGQNAEFALEFYFRLMKSDVRSKLIKSLGAGKYQIIGEVVFQTDEVWVLDFGICAYQESKPPDGISLGRFVEAEIYLGIDPFSYFDGFTRSKMPALIYHGRSTLSVSKQLHSLRLASLLGKGSCSR